MKLDLLTIIGNATTLHWVSGTNGGEYHGPCPFCGGKDRFLVQPNAGKDGNGLWTCRQCDDPHKPWHGPAEYLMRKTSCSLDDALQQLGIGNAKATPAPKPPEDPQTYPDRHGCTWADYATWGARLDMYADYDGRMYDGVFFPDASGGRWRLFNHPKSKFKPARTGQNAVLYGLDEAVALANSTQLNLLYLVNGQGSVIACQAHGIPAFTIPGGEGSIAGHITKTLFKQLMARWSGAIRVVLDGDATGYKSAPAIVDALAALGYPDVAALDAGQGNDAADLCVLNNGTTLAAFQQLPRLYPLPPPPSSPGAGTTAQNQPDRDVLFSYLDQEEAGDGQLLHALFAGKLAYDFAGQCWYEFGQHAWTRLDTPPRRLIWGTVASAYLNLAAEVQAAIATATGAQKAKLTARIDELTARARKLRHLNRVNNVLTLAQELLGVPGDIWDADPWLLGVRNGVLDLRTGQLRDGRPDDYIRTVAPTEWRGMDVPAPRWERFVSEVLSDEADRVAFLQRLLGYALNGSTEEHVLAIFVGERGRNGKRVLFEALQYVLGDYAKSTSTDVLVGQDHMRSAGSAQPHLMELQGRRIAYCSETGEHDTLSAAQVKNITGGDPITARWLHSNPVTFLPSHTLFLQTNRKPQAPADDDALWERVKLIEFKVRFVDEPSAPDDRPRDSQLESTLRSEASGILAWLVRGGREWQQSGLQTPASVRLARDVYRKGESIEPFLNNCCTEWDGGSAEGGALYEAYKTWCDLRAIRPKSAVWLGKQLIQKFEKGRVTAGVSIGRTVYYGVTLRDQQEWMTEQEVPEVAPTLQATTNPSVPIRTPNSADFSGNPEGLGSIPKSFHAKVTHEEKNMEIPSNPSDPSDKVTEHARVIHLPADPVITAKFDVGDQAIESRLHALVTAGAWLQARGEATRLHDEALRTAWLDTINTAARLKPEVAVSAIPATQVSDPAFRAGRPSVRQYAALRTACMEASAAMDSDDVDDLFPDGESADSAP